MTAEEAFRICPVIAILRGVDEKAVPPLVRALYEGGVRMIETAFEHTSKECLIENARKIELIRDTLGGQICVGAGTVLYRREAAAAKDAGAGFLVSPNTDRAIIGWARDRGLASYPGAATPTEMVRAWRAGATAVKLFPAGALGPAYLRAVKAALGQIKILAVGGVTCENAPEFYKAGACGAGVGSPLMPRAMIERGDWAQIASRAREFTVIPVPDASK